MVKSTGPHLPGSEAAKEVHASDRGISEGQEGVTHEKGLRTKAGGVARLLSAEGTRAEGAG